jgi:regulator of cell morphogenesis and NO signaling
MTTNVTTFDVNETLNEIVAREPRVLGVLQRYGLDTCCGGALPLATAAQHHGLDINELLAALRDAAEGA